MDTEIFSPVTLPCGRQITNRLVKVALYEHLAQMHGGPNKYHMALYKEWAKHHWGMIITGNIQVSRDHLSLGRDIVVPEVLNEETLVPFKTLARTIHAKGSRKPSACPLAIIQLSHAGRQSPNFIGGRALGVPPMAPSPVWLGSKPYPRPREGLASLAAQSKPHPYLQALFQQPQEMTLHDIEQAQRAFVKGALAALESGFDGIQLHGAHGYLLAQFLSPKSNVRRDEYSAESENALRMLRKILEAIRAAVPQDFVIGLKLNSADYVEAGENPSNERVLKESQRVLDHMRTIALWKMVDFIEISVGDYESPDFMSAKPTSPRQAFFAQFAKKARECLKTADVRVLLVILTGGLRSPAHLQSALDAGHTDLLGVGRGSILRPDLPAVLQERIRDAAAKGASLTSDNESFAYAPDSDMRLPSWLPQIPLLSASAAAGWYTVRLRRIATFRLENGIDDKALICPRL